MIYVASSTRNNRPAMYFSFARHPSRIRRPKVALIYQQMTSLNELLLHSVVQQADAREPETIMNYYHQRQRTFVKKDNMSVSDTLRLHIVRL